MTVSLKESYRRQADHFRRCDAMARSGVVANSAENEAISYKALLDAITPPNGQLRLRKVLDLGCQTGEAYFAGLHQFEYYAIEILPEVAQMAIDKGVPGVSVGFMEQLEYPDNFFDIVWARHVLEHSSDIEVVLNQIKRVLKPDGRIGFIVPIGVHREPAHIYELSVEQWKNIFENFDLELLTSWQQTFNLNEFGGVLKLK